MTIPTKSPLEASTVTRIVKSGQNKNVSQFGLNPLSFEPVNVPGRPKGKAQIEQEKHRELLELLQKRDIEKNALLVQLEHDKKVRYAQGFVEGEQKATEQYNQVLQNLQGNLQTLIETVTREKENIFLQFEKEAIALVTLCVHKVFDQIATTQTDAILPVLGKAVSALGPARSIVVRVHPLDFQTAQAGQQLWQSLEAQLEDVRLISDERMARGSCLVESDCASVGLNLQEMLIRLEHDLMQAWEIKQQVALMNTESPTHITEHP